MKLIVKTLSQIDHNLHYFLLFLQMEMGGNGDGSVFHTGITYLDEIICGLHKQELTIIGARPGVGKTTKVIVEIEEV